MLLRWLAPRPDWLPDELLGLYAQQDFGSAVCAAKMLIGGNIALLLLALVAVAWPWTGVTIAVLVVISLLAQLARYSRRGTVPPL